MIRKTIRLVVLAAAFTSSLPVWADYETGRRAWDAGHLDEALTQWRAAADAGDGRAMLALGQRYQQGLGVLQDYVEAHMWFNLAASRGEAAALGERDAVAAKMTPAQIAAAQQRAAAWRPGVSPGESAPATPAPPAAVSPSASEGDSPPPRAIREAQTLLGALGYRPGAPDGVWGERTAQAYRAFLLDAGLPVVDILTPDTLRELRARAQQRDGVAAEGTRDTTPRPDALHRAIQAGDIDAVNAAIAAGADVNARDARGWTALMHAANKGYTLMVPLLLEANAEVDIRAPDGATALFMAAVHGHAEIFAELMQAGADASIPGPQGRTPLDVARLKEGSRILALPEVVALLDAERVRRAREEAALRTQADSEAFSKAKSLQTRQAYKDYLSAWCPHGEHCDTARARLDDLVKVSIAGKGFRGTTSEGGTQSFRFFSSGEFSGRHLYPGIFSALLPIPNTMSGTWHVDQGRIQMHGTTDGMSRWTAVAEWEGGVLVVRYDDYDGHDRLTESQYEGENTQKSRGSEANDGR